MDARTHLISLRFAVNGQPHTVETPPMRRLLDVLREDLRLTGTKEGCGEGECGACAVLLDGELSNSCLIPALHAQGSDVTTIEGLADLYPGRVQASPDAVPAALSPIQQCFLSCGGAQCGICTPGMMLATHALLERYPDPTLPQMQEGLAGNLCRCTGYMRIFEAVRQAARLRRSSAETPPRHP